MFALLLLISPVGLGEAASTGGDKRLENSETNQAGPTTSSAHIQLQVSVGGPFQTAPLSAPASSSSTGVTFHPGFLGVATGGSNQHQLDITVLYAKTQPDPYGLSIVLSTWQTDADPIFYWQPPPGGVPVAGYSYALDATPSDTINTTATFWDVAQDAMKTLANGKHTFAVKAIGTSGTIGKAATFEMWVDAVAPSVGGVTPAGGSVLNTVSPVITMTLTDADSGVDPHSVGLVINGKSASVSYNESTGVATATGSGLLKEGANTLTLTASDRAGNTIVPLVWSLTADVTPPTGSVLINGGALLTTSVYVTLNLTAADAVSGVAGMLISNDPVIGFVQEPFASVRELWKLNAVKGTQPVYVKFIDGAGNISEAVSDDIGLNLLAPDTVIVSGPAGVTPETSAEFSVMCPEGGCVFSYAFDAQEWSAWTSDATASISSLPFGNHYFRVKAAKEANGTAGIQLDEEDPTPAERTWVVGVESGVVLPSRPPIKLWRLE